MFRTRKGRRRAGWVSAVALGGIAVLSTPVASAAQNAGYLDYESLTSELRSLAGSSAAAELSSIATTADGREVWVMELANRSGAPLPDRPAVLVVANLEGDHVVGSAHALEMIRYLIDGAQEEDIRETLDHQVIYVIPRLNPDGAEAMFANVTWERGVNSRPFDADNDGRTDEDGPDDLNGDGLITLMRVVDPEGPYRLDDDDPRLVALADAAKGEAGGYSLYWEGIDNDGDGFINEDGPGGVDLNRNFQHEYPYYGYGAGPHMVSEPETRGLLDFMTTHRNVGAIFTFGHSDNVVTPPNGSGALADANLLDLVAAADASHDGLFDVGVFTSGGGGFGFGFGFGFGGGGGLRGAQPGADNDPDQGRRPETTVHEDDREYFSTVSEAYKELTGVESVALNRPAAGAFFQYGYYQFGVPSFSTQGWSLPESTEEAEPTEEAEEVEAGQDSAAPSEPSTDATVLGALEAAGVDAFVEWTAYEHPTLGAVEIGGFRPHVTTNPGPDGLAELGRKHGEFIVRLAGMLPRVSFVATDVEAHGGGLFTIKAHIENSGYFPTALRHGVVSRAVQPTTVQIQVPQESIITGDDKTSTVQRLTGAHSRESFTWVVRGTPGSTVEIRVRSQKGGSDTVTVTLR